jgi:large subunit ribosomal protein L18
MFKRRRKQKTEYNQRLRLLKSKKTRLVVRRYLNGVKMQLVNFDIKGDITISEENSKTLKKFGWKGHTGNIPAAYLTGYLLGLKSKDKISEAVVDIGLHVSMKNSVIYAAIKGAIDGGLNIPVGEVLPDENKIKGKHIEDYAKKMKSEDPEKYGTHFSAYLKNNIEPTEIVKHFEEVKNNINKKSE